MAATCTEEARFRIFLNQCKNLALEKNANNFWRFEKYIEYLEKILGKLEATYTDKIDANLMATYRRDVAFLKGIVEAEKQETLERKLAVTEKLVAPVEPEKVQESPNETAAVEPDEKWIGESPPMRQVKAVTKAQYTRDIRRQLLGLEEESDASKSGLRLRKAGDALETGSADIDAVLKHHHDVQERLAEQFLQLTKNLKENAAAAGTVIRDDRKTLERLQVTAEQNFEELAKEAERLAYFAYKSCDWWIWSMLLIVCMTFIGMVLFMRIFPKPRYY